MAIAKFKPFLKYSLIIFSLVILNLTQLAPVLAEDAIKAAIKDYQQKNGVLAEAEETTA